MWTHSSLWSCRQVGSSVCHMKTPTNSWESTHVPDWLHPDLHVSPQLPGLVSDLWGYIGPQAAICCYGPTVRYCGFYCLVLKSITYSEEGFYWCCVYTAVTRAVETGSCDIILMSCEWKWLFICLQACERKLLILLNEKINRWWSIAKVHLANQVWIFWS